MRLTPRRQPFLKVRNPDPSAKRSKANKRLMQTSKPKDIKAKADREKLFKSEVLDSSKKETLLANNTSSKKNNQMKGRRPSRKKIRVSTGLRSKRRGISSNLANRAVKSKITAGKVKRNREQLAPNSRVTNKKLGGYGVEKRTRTPKKQRPRSTNVRGRPKSNNIKRKISGAKPATPRKFLKNGKRSVNKNGKREISKKKTQKMQELNVRWHRKKHQKVNKFDMKNSRRSKSPNNGPKRVARLKSSNRKKYSDQFGSISRGGVPAGNGYGSRSRSANPRSKTPKSGTKGPK